MSPDILSPLCARGRSTGRLSRVLARRRRRRFRVHNQMSVGDRALSLEVGSRRRLRRLRILKHNLNQRTDRFSSSSLRPRRPMSRAQHTLRIFALPLSKQSATSITATGKARAVLNTYYHFVTTPPSEVEQGNPSLISRATEKATNMWADWGKAEPGTWKVCI